MTSAGRLRDPRKTLYERGVDMKKLATAFLSGALALSIVLTGCAGKQAQTEPEVETTAEETEATEGGQLIVGGWTVQTEVTKALTDEQAELFAKGMEGLVGVSYEPVAELATQLVSGRNHAFLCTGETVTAEPVTNWYVVVIYEDLDGNAKVSNISQIDITNMQVTDQEVNTEVVGGWDVVEPSNAALLPEEAGTAFAKAADAWVGVSLNPIATLGTQLVSGTNYLVLCSGTTVTAEPKTSLYVATVYADLKGNASFSSVEQFYLPGYVTGV